MKKSTLLSMAAVAVLATSCSSEIPVPSGNDGNVMIRLQLPGQFRTRAYGDGLQATSLSYAIYDTETKTLVASGDDAATFTNLEATLQVQLVNGREYDFVFWADNGASSPYTFDAADAESDIKVDMDFSATNDEAMDAFYGTVTKKIAGPTTIQAILTRPFAQINLGTDDLDNKAVQTALTDVTTTLVTTTYTSLNPFTGEVLGEAEEVTFNAVPVPSGETFPVDGYEYLSMAYILVPAEQEVVDVEYTVINNGVTLSTLPVSNVPVQRNYRTNIYGSILTAPANIQIEIKPGFGGDDYNKELENVQSITSEDDIAEALEKGGNYSIDAPMGVLDLSALDPELPLTININSEVTGMKLNTTGSGNNAITINVAKDVPYPAFSFEKLGELKNVTITGDVTSSYKCEGLSCYGMGVTIDGLTVKNVAFKGKGVNLQYNSTSSNGYKSNMNNITIEGCDFSEMTEPAVSFQSHNPATSPIGNIVIKDNTISYADAAPANTNGLYLLNINSGTLTVEGNTISNAKYHGIQLTATAPMTVSGNKIVNALKDGIKMQSCGADMTITDNNVQAKENGIRVKDTLTSCDITVTDNTINMSGAISFDGSEPYGILIVNASTGASPLVKVADNIKVGNSSGSNWFNLTGFTPAAGSSYANPFSN